MNEINSSPPDIGQSRDEHTDPSSLPDRDDWTHRRHRLDAMILLFSIWLSYIIWKDNPDPLHVSVAFYLIAGLVTILGTYIVGSLFDYRAYLDAIRRG